MDIEWLKEFQGFFSRNIYLILWMAATVVYINVNGTLSEIARNTERIAELLGKIRHKHKAEEREVSHHEMVYSYSSVALVVVAGLFTI